VLAGWNTAGSDVPGVGVGVGIVPLELLDEELLLDPASQPPELELELELELEPPSQAAKENTSSAVRNNAKRLFSRFRGFLSISSSSAISLKKCVPRPRAGPFRWDRFDLGHEL
jgi:hypothetical protein